MEKKNKILIDLERLRYPNSGIANVCKNLAKGLYNTNDIDFTIYGPYDALRELDLPLEIRKWKSIDKFFAPFLRKYDVVHVTHQLSSYFYGCGQGRVKIVTLHDLNFLHENLSDSKRKKVLKRVNNNLKNADYIVCISHFVKEDFLKNKHLFTLNKLKEIFVIHNGIDLPEERDYELGNYHFLKEKKYILNIGVLFEKKNQKPLIEMLPYIEEDLVLVASGEKEPYATEVRELIKSLNLEDRVHFLKNISEEEKYAIIQNCSAMCHPSLAEGFGIPPIEAMAFGKPVFLSKYTSLPEIGGSIAFYFDNFNPQEMADFFNQKMSYYNHDIKEQTATIKNWSQQFEYQIMAENYHRLYNYIITQNK